jgi:hypothetical protein
MNFPGFNPALSAAGSAGECRLVFDQARHVVGLKSSSLANPPYRATARRQAGKIRLARCVWTDG